MTHMRRTFRVAAAGLLCALCVQTGVQAAELNLTVGYLRLEEPAHPVLSGLDPVPERRGIEGAELGVKDNQTTGGFLGHSYALDVVSLAPEAPAADVAAAARDMLAKTRVVVLDMSSEAALAVADLAEAKGAILINAASGDVALRGALCRANMLHTALEDGMAADALMQVLLSKRWTKLAMIVGPTPEDGVRAQTYRQAAQKFGLKIVSEATWTFDSDLRRAASREVPLLTQGFKSHDVVLIADAHDDFARYIEHNTWEPRPVAGAGGLTAVAWAPVIEQWGAAQLQSRFTDMTGRVMTPRDYAAWAAVRALGEAVTRTGSTEETALSAYLLSDGFELAGFQGRPLSFRNWNGQMRQPVPVVNAHAQVVAAPLEGFEHPQNPLDTLGTDQPESECHAFGE
ncbi:ABC transporter, substrate binding protein, PQQ-dependent alcohol dehydrogenase system [Celeribacter baekdonensis]|uniref:ABC transporter, substrate binding protein, PQQ-dependent alcohol dehydrogenase system n=1 Tax=Celeribacter baekdonensis TaxID=875171 RepID=A0A1G7GNU6_9RHOB|nr:ABC transporter substrate-binding protein [Celeribacter baekdonensis]SDE89669.1 ABC transporter, substrate binding protein, PQQ-dependent alcohol dehydrogenase system [Celeribacter baekdonensis]